jgi:hypothetical protein
MPIKDLNDLIREGVIPGRTTAPKPKVNPKYTTMSEVVPPLNRSDFLHKWKEDRAQLEKVRKERDDAVKETKRLKGIMNTTWSKDWRSKVNEEEKK